MNKYTVKNHNGEIIYEGYSAFECLQKREREIATGDLCTVEVERSQDEFSGLVKPTAQGFTMLDITYFSFAERQALKSEVVYFAPVGSVIRSKKTGKLWAVTELCFPRFKFTRKTNEGLYAPALMVRCEDSTETLMFNELMAENFEIVSTHVKKCDRKTFKSIRRLIALNVDIGNGYLVKLARSCYPFKAAPYNLIKPLLCTSIKTGKLMLDDTFKIDHKNRTALIFGRVTPLFNVKGKKA